MKKITAMIFILVLIASASFANDQTVDVKRNIPSGDVKILVDRFMDQVFSTRIPTLTDYYTFEGPHSEDEYSMEIQSCKSRWGNPQNLDDKAYALQMPKECVDWMVERDAKRDKNASLYYQSIRNRFKKFPLKYQIKSTQLTDHGYLVDVSLSDENAAILLNVYKLELAVTDPELVIIAIKKIKTP